MEIFLGKKKIRKEELNRKLSLLKLIKISLKLKGWPRLSLKVSKSPVSSKRE